MGARTDLLVLSIEDAALIGGPDSHLMDATVFAASVRPLVSTWVAGQGVQPDCTAPAMQRAMRQLRSYLSHAAGG